jgi:hypothetical protein
LIEVYTGYFKFSEMPPKKASKRLKVLNKKSVLQLEAKPEIPKKNSEMTEKVLEEPDVYV